MKQPPFLRLITPDTEDGGTQKRAPGGLQLFQTAFQVKECTKFSTGIKQPSIRHS
jgi:hypothetical protein